MIVFENPAAVSYVGIRLVGALRGDVGPDESGLDPSSWALDLR